MRGDEGVHEGLKVWTPPLGERVANLPLVVDALARELGSDGGQTLVQAVLEALELAFVVVQVIARSLIGAKRVSTGVCVLGLGRGGRGGAYSLKKAFAICSIRMCG